MNSNKRINLLVDLVKLALIILIACVLVSVIVFVVSDDPWTAISSFFLGPFTSLRRVGNIIEAASPLMFTALAVIIIFGSGQFSMIAEQCHLDKDDTCKRILFTANKPLAYSLFFYVQKPLVK